ncbi:MAG: hypothetical protein EOP88_00325 [Verrucomicrobiaceae bacterium]|nr:MAG: hypothetical protein EOP88_00325 [Verrucomicrobiaceae bacterium]
MNVTKGSSMLIRTTFLLAALTLGGRLHAGLVGHYRFDEDAGATTAVNQVGGTSPGIVGASVTTGVNGVAGKAYRFSNSAVQAGIVDMGNAAFLPKLTAKGALTYSAWVKTGDTSGGRNVAVFAGNDAVTASYIDMGLAAAQVGQLGSAYGRFRPSGNVGLIEHFSTPKVINDNGWHHVSMTVESNPAPGRLVLYVDGVEKAAGALAGGQIPTFNNFEIGRLGRNNPADPFDGTIDDVQVYDEALTAEKVKYLFDHPGMTASDPVPPVVAPDETTLHHHGSVLLPVLSNDEAGIPVTGVEIVTPPASGTAAVDAQGRILYKHLNGTPATDSFTYRVLGDIGLFSEPATVTLHFSTALRIPNTTVAMPTEPPPVAFSVVNAFPGVGFTNPATMESAPGDTKRLFVGERGGKIFLIPDVTAVNPVKILYLDLSAITLDDGNEQGLKGFALHPRFAENGYVFVAYNHLEAGLEYVRLSRFKATSPTTNTPISAATEEILINQLFKPETGNQPRVHNLAECNFGPDGYLYLGMGDADGHPDPSDNSQRIDKNFWSCLMRMDVDLEPQDHTAADGTGGDDANLPPNSHPAIVLHGGFPLYEIPADNPFIGATSFNGFPVDPANVRTEFYAVGLRNPWQFTWDMPGGNFWVADVGYNTREEVNLVTKGGNYGWVFMEGTLPRKGTPPPGAVLVPPVYEYDHGSGPYQGNAIIGGLVYRGASYPSLYGKYIFADHLSGNIWSMNTDGGPPQVQRIAGESGITCFAMDPSGGSLLMLDLGDGAVRRLVSTPTNTGFPPKLSATGVFADLTDLAPNPGVVAYEPNLTFWSDYAVKSRWFVMKDMVDKFSWSDDGPWQSPAGAVFVKHFELELERGNPATRKRLETRLLVRTEGGNYGVSYRWNEQGTDADLVADEGASFDLNVTDAGTPVVQRWQIPSRSQCGTCHTAHGGHFLSLNTRQLNRPGMMAGTGGNFLTLMELSGYLDHLPGSPNLLPRHVRPDETAYALETRARSYLAVNCSYCHQSGGIGGGEFDVRPELSLEETGIVHGGTSTAGPPYKLVVPGDHDLSVIWNRAAAANGFTRMPPLASNQVDKKGIQLLRDWIDEKLPHHQSYGEWRLARFGSGGSTEGNPDEDPDHDGLTNRQEFLLNSDPGSGAGLPGTGLTLSDQWLTFPNLENRRVWVESSTDL